MSSSLPLLLRATVVVLCLLPAACGLKGDLYLPEEPADPTPSEDSEEDAENA